MSLPPPDLPPPDLPFSPAAERNQTPVLDALQRLLPPAASVLEIASGTGQHARHVAAAKPRWTWQPTDADARMLEAIDARCAGLANVRPARRLDVLDVLDDGWPLAAADGAPYDAVYTANLLHISPWPTCPALMRGAAAHLRAGGLLLVYGPFRVDGVPTAPSNEAFDADLRARDPRWGLRRLADVQTEAAAAGLGWQQTVVMPANNLLVVFEAPPPSQAP
jgi:SAM-dependent methyltransferase